MNAKKPGSAITFCSWARGYLPLLSIEDAPALGCKMQMLSDLKGCGILAGKSPVEEALVINRGNSQGRHKWIYFQSSIEGLLIAGIINLGMKEQGVFVKRDCPLRTTCHRLITS